jgi:hypothetical protein
MKKGPWNSEFAGRLLWHENVWAVLRGGGRVSHHRGHGGHRDSRRRGADADGEVVVAAAELPLGGLGGGVVLGVKAGALRMKSPGQAGLPHSKGRASNGRWWWGRMRWLVMWRRR